MSFCRKKIFIRDLLLVYLGSSICFIGAMEQEPPVWAARSALRSNRQEMVELLSLALVLVQQARAEVFNNGDAIKNVRIRAYLEGVINEKYDQLTRRCPAAFAMTELETVLETLGKWKSRVGCLLRGGIANIPPLNLMGWVLLVPAPVPLAPIELRDLIERPIVRRYREQAEERATQLGCPEYNSGGWCVIQ